MRIDKFLSQMGQGTRTEVKTLLKTGKVRLNEHVVKSPKLKIDPTQDVIEVDGQRIQYEPYVYLMMHKPKNVISATEDDQHETVIDLIQEYAHLNLFPVGRLDKDTEGLLLITNDGQFNHQLMNPNQHVPKTYYVETLNPISETDITVFKTGVTLKEGVLKPATLQIISAKHAFLTISEGKFHQVKRMFHSVGNEVVYLKRVKIANLSLDTSLAPGAYRKLTADDFKTLGFEASLN
ncbi:rRNA pseudouridine synthase [Staphylococcus hyicus]|uniref:pseudouridine synthase n=1 Tax=Staphylococcus hyicus TaxID=1284 RepID=UPI00211BA6C0|nr:rRNA pseudouridine synthase [Staphylococcus hyicus]MCQ9291074.1 rRNA pseudouridine synthase [Staphylococcus hyicus]MCQ9306315.1 rRNA pseudouridine synthase [Staphylococcus hyicus]MCQ9308728.1 rRNA pseudouridine synthase [Staphylococcus hyicus]MCQ9311149.1 rRNA pseudouridine synthase [Staphylococcus hyicus]